MVTNVLIIYIHICKMYTVSKIITGTKVHHQFPWQHDKMPTFVWPRPLQPVWDVRLQTLVRLWRYKHWGAQRAADWTRCGQKGKFIQWWFVYLDTFVPCGYFWINKFSRLLNRPLVRTGKLVPTLFVRTSEISGLSEPGLMNHQCSHKIFLKLSYDRHSA